MYSFNKYLWVSTLYKVSIQSAKDIKRKICLKKTHQNDQILVKYGEISTREIKMLAPFFHKPDYKS